MSRFDDFWNIWPSGPRKVNRKGCAKRWADQKLDEHADKIIAHVQWSLKNNPQWKGGFVPMPMTYLNQARYDDGTFQAGKLFEKREYAPDGAGVSVNWCVDWVLTHRTLTQAQICSPWQWLWDGQRIKAVRIPGEIVTTIQVADML